MLIHDYFDFYALRSPDTQCLIFEETIFTYSDANVEISKLITGLRKQGVQSGDRLAILCENCPEFFFLLFAASKLGCVILPLNYRLAPPELLFVIEDSNPVVILAPDDNLKASLNGLEQLSSTLPIVISKGLSSNENSNSLDWNIAFNDESISTYSAGNDDSSAIMQLYTSGTTGKPKGVMLSQKNVLAQINSALFSYKKRPQPHCLDLVCAPNFHIAGCVSSAMPIIAGGGLVLHKTFDPVKVVQDLQTHPISTAFMVPAMVMAIVHTVPGIEQMKFPKLNQICYGASPINPTLLKQAIKIFDCDFYQLYGLTETTGTVISLSADDHIRALNGEEHLLESCGRPQIGAKIKIIDKHGNELPTGEVGEVIIKSDVVMMGYHGLENATAETIIDGWLHTGDSALVDEQGYLYIKDRIKDMVVSGAENIYPIEVENIIAQHDNIQEVAVVGIPDEKFGEALLACVVLTKDAVFSCDEMIDFCRDKLAGYKIPRQLQILDELPRNPTGKILKKDLREPYWKNHNRSVG